MKQGEVEDKAEFVAYIIVPQDSMLDWGGRSGLEVV